MEKDVFTVHWKRIVNGKEKKFARSFDTKEERNTFMETLKSDPANNVYRFTDFEILTKGD